MIEEILPGYGAIDIGSGSYHVAVAQQPVARFDTFTSGLKALEEYLRVHEVRKVAMEATGVYWISLHDHLDEAGFEVTVFNGAHARNMPGRKTDAQDAQWHAMLHSHGLLQRCFIPPAEIRELRTVYRLREDHLGMKAMQVQHMHKALTAMNVRLHNVISQLDGVSGQRIMEAIVAGERNPVQLAQLCDPQILKKKKDLVIESLRGTWLPQHLFALEQAMKCYRFFEQRMLDCDREIETLLHRFVAESAESMEGRKKERDNQGDDNSDDDSLSGGVQAGGVQGDVVNAGSKLLSKKAVSKKPVRHNAPEIAHLNELLAQLCNGNDASLLPGISPLGFLKLVGEVGTDLSAWPTAKHFTSWLGLAPNRHESGKMKRRVRRRKTKAGQIFREAAMSISRSRYLALGGFYHRIKGRHGAPVAMTAVARKLAELFYRFMTKGIDYVEQGLQQYEEEYRERKLRYHQRQLEKLAASKPG